MRTQTAGSCLACIPFDAHANTRTRRRLHLQVLLYVLYCYLFVTLAATAAMGGASVIVNASMGMVAQSAGT